MRTPRYTSVALLVLAALAVAACGSGKKKSSTSGTSSSGTSLSISVSEKGKVASYTLPASTKGGLVKVTLQNTGKAPHQAQFAEIGNHKPQEVLKALGTNKTPSWLHGYGGPSANPGQTGKASVILPAGNYLVLDGAAQGRPGYKQMKVTAGQRGSLPSTSTTITAAAPAKDKYKWEISGPLKAGHNQITFTSKGGKNAIHLIVAARITGNPSQSEIKKALASNGKPPAFIDQKSFTSTTVLDGTNKSQVTDFSLTKPGKYVLFCPLTDRDGGKSHDREGLLTTVNVK